VGSRAGLDAVAKKKNPCLCRESNPGRPSHSLDITVTELSRLKIKKKRKTNISAWIKPTKNKLNINININ
jgi:hypothetical protein